MQTNRPKILTLTDVAAKQAKDIIANSITPIEGLLIGVKNGGCVGMEYTMNYCEDVLPAYEMVEDKGVKIFIEPSALLFLLGTEVDYKVEKLSSGFTFNNPNQLSACGCGESVEIKPLSEEDRARFSN